MVFTKTHCKAKQQCLVQSRPSEAALGLKSYAEPAIIQRQHVIHMLVQGRDHVTLQRTKIYPTFEEGKSSSSKVFWKWIYALCKYIYIYGTCIGPNGQNLIFQQPRFHWNRGFPFLSYMWSCEIATIWPNVYNSQEDINPTERDAGSVGFLHLLFFHVFSLFSFPPFHFYRIFQRWGRPPLLNPTQGKMGCTPIPTYPLWELPWNKPI